MNYFEADSASPFCSSHFPQSLGHSLPLSRDSEDTGVLLGGWFRIGPALPLPITPVLMTTPGVQGALSNSRILREYTLALRSEEISLPLLP